MIKEMSMTTHWIWQKAPLENDYFIQASSKIDRATNQIILATPDNIEKGLLSDVLHSDWEQEWIVSNRVAALFYERQVREVTVRDIVLPKESGLNANDWKHITVVGQVLGIDYQKSHYHVDPDDNSIDNIDKLVLNLDNITRSKMEIFRLYGYRGYPDWTIISDGLKQQLEAMKITGVEFIAID